MQHRPADPASIIYDLPSILERMDISALFPRAQSVEIELGCGDGSFLVNYARRHPDRNFIGVERLLGRIRKVDRKARRAELRNVRAVRIESAYLLEFLLPPRSMAAIHVYFPDPWPKRKHRRNRLVNERFPEIARQALSPGGIVWLRTDHADYFAQMESVFGASKWFQRMETPAELSAVVTDFEAGFQKQGIQTLRAAFRLISPPAPAV